MTTRRGDPVDFASVQNTRASCTAALTKALDQLEAIPTSTFEEVSLMNSEDVDWILNSILNPESTFLQSMEDGQLFIPEEDEENFLLEEDLAEESFNDAIFDVNYRGKQLLCMKAITNGLSKIYSNIEAIQVTINSSPETNLVSETNKLNTLLSSLRHQAHTASLPQNNSIKLELQSCTRALVALEDKISSHNHKLNTQRLQRLKEAILYPELPPLPPITEITDCCLEVAAESNTEQFHQQKSHAYSASPTFSTSSFPSYKWNCALCRTEKHPLHICPKWLNYTIYQRVSHVSSKKLCANCLAVGHLTAACRSNYRCRSCGQAHHTTIHQEIPDPTQLSSTLTQSQQLPDALLMTAVVPFKEPEEQQPKDRASIHTDAGLSLTSVKTSQTLELPLPTSKTTLSTVQGTGYKGSQHVTSVTTLHLQNEQNIQCRPAVLKTVIDNLSSKQFAPFNNSPHSQGSPQQELPAGQMQPNSSTSNNLASDVKLAEESELSFSSDHSQLKHHYSNHVYVSSSNCRQQMTLPEKSDCQHPREDCKQTVLPNLALSQQPWEKCQKKHSTWKDEFPSLSPTQLQNSSNPTVSDSVNSELYEFSHSALHNCTTVVHPRTTSQEYSSTTLLATSKPSSRTCASTAEHSLTTSLTNSKQPPQKELLKLLNPVLEPLTPVLKLLNPVLEPLTSVLKPPTTVLELPTPVDTSTILSTTATDSGNSHSTNSHASFYTDWCWKFGSTFIYNGAPPSAATNCLPLMIPNLQNPAASSVPRPTSAEKKTAEIWLLQQANIQLHNFRKSSIRKKRFFSKSSRLMPWHPNLDSSQMLTTGKIPANFTFHPLQQHQLLADANNHSSHNWLKYFYLTLCQYDSIFFCTSDATFILLSARRLSRPVCSNSYWRISPLYITTSWKKYQLFQTTSLFHSSSSGWTLPIPPPPGRNTVKINLLLNLKQTS